MGTTNIRGYILNEYRNTNWFPVERTVFNNFISKLPPADSSGVDAEHYHNKLKSFDGTTVISIDGTQAIYNYLNPSEYVMTDANRKLVTVPLSDGIQGQTGVQGITGLTGATGVQGITGLTGVTGIQGQTGVQGITGLRGATGVQGQTGVQGVTGLRGFTGLSGQDATNIWSRTSGDITQLTSNTERVFVRADSSNISLLAISGGIDCTSSYFGVQSDYDIMISNSSGPISTIAKTGPILVRASAGTFDMTSKDHMTMRTDSSMSMLAVGPLDMTALNIDVSTNRLMLDSSLINSGNVENVHYYEYWNTSDATARRYELARIGVDRTNWGTYSNVSLELIQHTPGDVYKRYDIFATYRDATDMYLREASGGRNLEITGLSQGMIRGWSDWSGIGGGQIGYVRVFVDLSNFMRMKAKLTHSRVVTSSSTPAKSEVWVNPSYATAIATIPAFNLDETSYVDPTTHFNKLTFGNENLSYLTTSDGTDLFISAPAVKLYSDTDATVGVSAVTYMSSNKTYITTNTGPLAQANNSIVIATASSLPTISSYGTGIISAGDIDMSSDARLGMYSADTAELRSGSILLQGRYTSSTITLSPGNSGTTYVQGYIGSITPSNTLTLTSNIVDMTASGSVGRMRLYALNNMDMTSSGAVTLYSNGLTLSSGSGQMGLYGNSVIFHTPAAFENRIKVDARGDTTAQHDLTLENGNLAIITGSGEIWGISTVGWAQGSTVTLQFDTTNTITLKSGMTGSVFDPVFPLRLKGRVDMTTNYNSIVRFMYDGLGWWNELSRIVH